MEPLPINQREIMIRYGRLAPHARDRILDQFYLNKPGRSFMETYFLTLVFGFASILIPLIGLLWLMIQVFHLPSFDVMWLSYLATAVLQMVWFVVVLTRQARKKYKELPLQTTEIGLSDSRINFHSRHIHGGYVQTSVCWKDLSTIRLIQPSDKAETFGSYLELCTVYGAKLRLYLDCIQTIEERHILREFILRFAPHIDIKEALTSLLRVGKVDTVPFTKLWSQALHDARPRVHTAPLVGETSLQDGRFVIKACIGSGGQGAVYLSAMTDVGAVSEVVLKEYVLPDVEHAAEHKNAVEQFEKEVRLLSKIDHPGVIKMLDVFVQDHRVYLVLQHVDGISLREYVHQNGPLSQARMIRIAQQMCDILEYLHSRKPAIMHLDFSPENILLSKDDRITLIDFNISVEENAMRTRTVMGKQRYMAPEQYRGKPSVRSDIYSFGGTMFFALTGKEPEPISISRPSSENEAISPQINAIVVKSTATEEEDRYQSAAEIRLALSAVNSDLVNSDLVNSDLVDSDLVDSDLTILSPSGRTVEPVPAAVPRRQHNQGGD